MAEPIDFYFDFSSPYGYLMSEKIDTLAACIQPLIVFIMAGMVGFMAYIMMSTIFETMSAIK